MSDCHDNTSMSVNASENEIIDPASCYPTGCTPCTSPIDFPDLPVDGDRHCVPIGANGEQKCWVYDKCIPGWRAEGPATSPTRYRGVINVCVEKPADFNEQAGDWLIAAADCAQAHNSWGLNLTDVKAGDRVAFNGTQWQDFPPPEVPFASEALDGDVPDPDTRIGGIVKNATVNQALAGTNKCDSITPYTLQAKLDATRPNIPGIDGGSMAVVVSSNSPSFCDGDDLVLKAEATPLSADGDRVVGLFTYTWQSSTNGSDWVNIFVLREHTGTTDSHTTHTVDNYNGTPSQFRVQVQFEDLFGTEIIVVSEVITPVEGSTASISSQPVTLDLSDTETGTFTVAHTGPAASAYRWFINNLLITGATTPDVGYSFANFTTNTLSVTRTEADARSFTVRVEIENGSDCNPMLVSNNVQLTGPDGTEAPSAPSTEYGGIGTYTFVYWTEWLQYGQGISNGPGSIIDIRDAGSANEWKIPIGTWRVMGAPSRSGHPSGEPESYLILRIA